MFTLGINAAFHDSAACLVEDGRVVAAAEEERFTRIKHGKRPHPFSAYELPFHAIDYCLSAADIHLRDVDHIAYSYDPFVRLGAQGRDAALTLPLEPSAHPAAPEWESVWEPLFLASIVNAPRHLAGGWPHHLARRAHGIRHDGPFRWHFVKHHLAHAASAFLCSPFARAAVMTLDGRGETATTTYAVGEGTGLRRIGQVDMPHSLGLLYERVTTHLGFLHSEDEYKVMALASFGRPAFLNTFREMVAIDRAGRYRVADTPLADCFGPARLPGEPIERRHRDLARSLQAVLEESVLALAQWLHEETRMDNLCLAGGVALNCVLNGRLQREGPFRDLWVQPAAGDAGTALGAALWVDARERGQSERGEPMRHAFLGPAFGETAIESLLRESSLSFRRVDDIAAAAADLLTQNRVVGWFQGRMEFGPRALGARSILASPCDAGMQARLNAIKDREDFRPVAPAVTEERASEWFLGARPSPFMLFVYAVRPDKAGRVPAVRHIDGTARVQTVSRQNNPLFHALIEAFARRTGVPVLINTSFNTRGRPIVCTPRDALEAYFTSPLDALAIGPFLLEKRG